VSSRYGSTATDKTVSSLRPAPVLVHAFSSTERKVPLPLVARARPAFRLAFGLAFVRLEEEAGFDGEEGIYVMIRSLSFGR